MHFSLTREKSLPVTVKEEMVERLDRLNIDGKKLLERLAIQR